MTHPLRIGDLAKATRTKVETIRYYERIGLLPKPDRTSGNYRSYRAGHRARLAFIRRAREFGFSIGQIRGLLSLADHGERSCLQVDAIAREHLAEVDARIRALRSLRRELDAIIRKCDCGTVAHCRIIEALGSGALS